jgi:hypothetical protein
MENENRKHAPLNGAAPTSKGSTAPIAKPQEKNPEVKEGNSSQQRPTHGADGGPNTSSRDDQLPALDNSGAVGLESDKDLEK